MVQSSTNSIASESNQSVNSIKGITAYVERGPIEILNDSAFGPSGYNFTGTGTYNDPYLIENYNITASSVSLIHIENTTKYFKMSNCYLNGLDSAYNMTRLINVTHGTIETNYFCHGRSMGISLLHCTNNSIINNELNYIWSTGVGIYLFYSDNNTCSYNTIHEEMSVGIWLEFSHFNNLSSNSIYDVSAYGFTIIESNNNTYLYNTIRDHPLSGFFMQDSNNCTFSYNIIKDTTIAIKHQAYPSGGGYYNTFTHNTIYNSTVEGISLQDAINATISNNRIYNCGPNTLGLTHFLAGKSPYGISLSASHNNTINNNLIYDNFDYGLYFHYDSENNTATLNVFVNNSYGFPSNASAFDDGTNNVIKSNYWDDYIGSGNYTLDALGRPTNNNDTSPVINPTPSVNIDSPLNQTYYENTINIILSGFAIHFGYNIHGLDGDILSFRPWISNEERTLNSGTYTLEAMGRITDTTYALVSVTFTISLPPIITLNSPENDTTHRSGTIIDVDITDNDLDTVLYNWDGTPNQTWSSNYVTPLPTGDSQHVLSVYANDSLGNWTSENFAFTTDDTGPTVSITNPTGTTYETNDVVLSYTVSEGTVTIYINGFSNTSAVPSGTVFPGFANGIHNFTIIAVDEVGNIGTDTVIFTINVPNATSYPGLITILIFSVALVLVKRRRRRS